MLLGEQEIIVRADFFATKVARTKNICLVSDGKRLTEHRCLVKSFLGNRKQLFGEQKIIVRAALAAIFVRAAEVATKVARTQLINFNVIRQAGTYESESKLSCLRACLPCPAQAGGTHRQAQSKNGVFASGTSYFNAADAAVVKMFGSEIYPYAILVTLVCLAHVIHGITGFGAMVLSLPLLSLVFPVKTILPVMVVVSFFQVSWFVITQWSYIHFKHAAYILVLAILGFPLGFAVFTYLPTEWLEVSLGIFVIAVAMWNLSGIETSRKMPQPVYYLLNFVGGIVQGALASGGPLLVIYAAKMIEDKSEFRATLSLIWVVLGAFLVASYTLSGAWKSEMVPLILLGLPAVVIGTAAGIYLHDRIPQKPFRIMVFVLLLISGAVLVRPLFLG